MLICLSVEQKHRLTAPVFGKHSWLTFMNSTGINHPKHFGKYTIIGMAVMYMGGHTAEATAITLLLLPGSS